MDIHSFDGAEEASSGRSAEGAVDVVSCTSVRSERTRGRMGLRSARDSWNRSWVGVMRCLLHGDGGEMTGS